MIHHLNVCSRCLSPRRPHPDGEWHCIRRRWWNALLHDKSVNGGYNAATRVASVDVVPLSPFRMLVRWLRNPLREMTTGPSVSRPFGWVHSGTAKQ